MKILNVVYSLGKGGTERAAQNFALGYAALGCDSRLVFTRLDGERKEYLEEKKITVYSLLNDIDLARIKDWNPDVVHLHSHGLTLKEFEVIKSIAINAKYVETNVFSEPSPWAGKINISYQLSEWCLWLYKKRSHDKFRSAIIPYPVDASSFNRVSDECRREFRAKNNIKESDIVIGRIGQNSISKWSVDLVGVFERLRRDDDRLKLLVVNPPDLICERIASSVFKADIIQIDQIRGDSNLAICYSAIDVFVLISQIGESFGMVLAESLLCETPAVVLATPWGDNSQGEVIGNNIGGFVAINKSELAKLVGKLINDASLRRRMGMQGRNHIIDRYNSPKIASDSLIIMNQNNAIQSKNTPLDLLLDGYGSINLISRIILKSEKFYALLFYTLGYQSIFKIPSRLLSSFKRRLNIKLGI